MLSLSDHLMSAFLLLPEHYKRKQYLYSMRTVVNHGDYARGTFIKRLPGLAARRMSSVETNLYIRSHVTA